MLQLPNVLIIADGDKLCQDKLCQLAQDKVVCVLDGAYPYAESCGLSVDCLMGDFDTLDQTHLPLARQKGIHVIHTPDQNFTDLDKAVMHMDSEGVDSIDIACATGKRFDHTLHNIQLLTRFYRDNRPIVIHTDHERIFLLKDDTTTLMGKPGDGIAIFGAPECTVTSQGLAYELDAYHMTYGGQNSACNTFTQAQVTLKTEGLALVIVYDSGSKSFS